VFCAVKKQLLDGAGGVGELSDAVASACPVFPHGRQALAGGGMVSGLVWYRVLGVLISGGEMLIWIVSHRPRFKSRARLMSNSSSSYSFRLRCVHAFS